MLKILLFAMLFLFDADLGFCLKCGCKNGPATAYPCSTQDSHVPRCRRLCECSCHSGWCSNFEEEQSK